MKKKLFNIIKLTTLLFSFNFECYGFVKIYVNSIPKCGTHLLTKCISLITKKDAMGFPTDKIKELPKLADNEFFFCHLPYSKNLETNLKENKFKVFFIYRDPRDQVVSHAFWIMEDTTRYLKKNKPPEIYSNNIHDIISLFIKNINSFYKNFLPWLKSPITCSIKFEDLIGNEGKGNQEKQKTEIKKICTHLNFNNIQLEKTINYCIKNLFGGTGTFRNGKIGEWKEYFTEEQKNEFKKIAGQLLIDLGYEKDLNW